MRRVHLHSGGLTATDVRAGTGGRKPSQWRTENKPPTRTLCARCVADKALVSQAETFLAQHKQPPLYSTRPTEPGAPGTKLRRKAKAAADRLTRCRCTPPPAKKTKPAATSPARKATASRASSSTDPYQQVLAHDRAKASKAKKKPK